MAREQWSRGQTPPQQPTQPGQQSPMMDDASWPFEEPEQSPELRQERSPALYNTHNPFWNQPPHNTAASQPVQNPGQAPRQSAQHYAQSSGMPPQMASGRSQQRPTMPGQGQPSQQRPVAQTPYQASASQARQQGYMPTGGAVQPNGAAQPQGRTPPQGMEPPQRVEPPHRVEPPLAAAAAVQQQRRPDILDTDSYTGETPRYSKRRRNWLMGCLVVVAVLILLAALFFGVICRVRKINVIGNVNISDEEIIALSQIQIGQSIFLDEEALRNRIQQNPYLRYDIYAISSYDTITIQVKERQETACLTSGGIGIVTDSQGHVLRTYNDPLVKNPNLVTVQGMSIKRVIIGQKIVPAQQQQLDAVTEELVQLKVMGCIDEIAVLDVSSLDRITMQTRDGMQIILGDSDLLHEKTRAFTIVRQWLAENGETGGTLTLSNPVEPVYTPSEVP